MVQTYCRTRQYPMNSDGADLMSHQTVAEKMSFDGADYTVALFTQ